MPRRCSSTPSAWFTRLALFLGAGCSSGAETETGSPSGSRESLVSLDGWTAVERADDPFVSSPNLAPECAPAFHVEDAQNWLEIDTTTCNWVTLTQSARALQPSVSAHLGARVPPQSTSVSSPFFTPSLGAGGWHAFVVHTPL